MKEEKRRQDACLPQAGRRDEMKNQDAGLKPGAT
jgi:hypothetical protein